MAGGRREAEIEVVAEKDKRAPTWHGEWLNAVLVDRLRDENTRLQHLDYENARLVAEVEHLREVVAWLLPYAEYPECICDKGTIGACDCNLEEAQRNYWPTIEKAQAFLRTARSPQSEDQEA